MIDDASADRLSGIALQLRCDLLEMIGVGKAGHLGGSSSLAETVAALYFQILKPDRSNPNNPDRDRLILSKGHAALIQYAALCELGYFSREELGKVKTLNGLLQGHPDLSIPGVEAVTGSLGQGLSIGIGMALAMRLDGRPGRVYVIMGDGEQSEGQLWEAAMAAVNFKLDNLTAFLDRNNVQASGPTNEVFSIPDLDKKWSAFGWDVFTVNGHEVRDIVKSVDRAKGVKGRPALIILDTVKGKGFSFAEGNAAFHNGILTEEQFARARRELDEQKARVGSWKK